MKRTKRALIWRFLRPYLWLFALTLAFSMGNTVFSSLTPQVVRVAVDSILGGEPFPKAVTALAPARLLAAPPMTQLFAAAGFLLAVAVLAGLCTYGSRMGTAFASGWRGFVNTLESLAVALAYGWVWLLLLAVIGAVVGRTLWRRRRRERHQTVGDT